MERDSSEEQNPDTHMATDDAPPAWAIAMMAGLDDVKRSMK
jgi:hypothetical protein